MLTKPPQIGDLVTGRIAKRYIPNGIHEIINIEGNIFTLKLVSERNSVRRFFANSKRINQVTSDELHKNFSDDAIEKIIKERDELVAPFNAFIEKYNKE